MIVFYSLTSATPNIRKISLMLNETGLPYRVKDIHGQNDGKFTDDFMAISPNGTVPAILDEENGAVLFESGAILHYLAEKSGSLLPANIKDRSEVMKWLMFEVSNMGPTMGEIFHYMVQTPEEIGDVHMQRYKDKVAQFCAILDRQLNDREYLCGEYSIADIALYPWHVVLEDLAEVNLGDYPNLNNWANKISKRPAAAAKFP
jgi:GST-like protein